MKRFGMWILAGLFLLASVAAATSGLWRNAAPGGLFGKSRAAGNFASTAYSEDSASGVVRQGGATDSANPGAASGKPVELPGAADAQSFAETLRQGAVENPAEAENLLRRAMEASQAGNSWQAASDAREALRLGADDAAAWMLFAENARRSDNADEAAIAAHRALSRTGEDGVRADILKFLGDLYESRGEEAAAVAVYRDSIRLRSDGEISERLARLTGQKLFALNHEVINDSDQPELCVNFSWALREDGEARYEDYVRVAGKGKFTAWASGRSLCLGGFVHGQRLEVRLLKGLPAQSGAKLAADYVIDASFEDRPARLSFNDRAFILPRVKSAGVPLTALNLSRARLELFRINDRNLVPQFERGGSLQQLWGYDARQIADSHGEKIWSGEMSFEVKRNRATQAAVPIDDMLPERKPGLYVLTAQPDNESADQWDARATQWLIVTDIGLSTLSGPEGMTALARSYADASPISGLRLQLLARNNSVLGEATTDANGRARFAPGLARGKGGTEPRLLLAFGRNGEFTFVDLGQPGFDLSDRGAGGRVPPKGLDAFVYTDRGIYRPGEESPVRLGVLLRDETGAAAGNPPPLTLRVFRPDGAEAERRILQPEANTPSAYFADIKLPATARTGSWSAALYLPGREGELDELNRVSFAVEDFVPARLELTLSPKAESFSGTTPIRVDVNAQYLYGAPGAGLNGESVVNVRRIEAPFPKYTGFRFGLIDEAFNDVSAEVNVPVSDAAGKSSFLATLPEIPALSQPLEALVSVTVFEEGGRPIQRAFTAPIARAQPFVGLRLKGGEGVVSLDQPAVIEAVAVDWRGARTALTGLRYRIVREDYRYVWSRNGDSWNYRYVPRDLPVGSGAFQITSQKIATLETPALRQWGSYRVEIYDPRDGAERRAAASLRVYAGWRYGGEDNESPDSLSVVADKPSYVAGDTARILVKSPFAGDAELTLAREGVIESRRFRLTADGKGQILSIPVRDSWGPGVYAIVHAFRPSLKAGEKPGDAVKTPVRAGKAATDAPAATASDALQGPQLPGRAIGLAWLGIDPKARSLDVKFALPAEIRPRQTLKAPFTVEGAAGESVMVTLAAVDEGVLQLTGFQTPDPATFMFGKRRLGLDLRDSYGRLIDPRWHVLGKIKSGGDAAARQSGQLPDRWIKPLALWSGVVRLDRAGKGSVSLDLPEFQGKIRLMAVAASRRKAGSGEANMLVRDPVVVNASPPRFLSPGDEAFLTLTFHNVSGPAGTAQLALTAEGNVGVEALPKTLAMKAGEKIVRRVRLTGKSVGSGRIRLAFTPPGGAARPDLVWPITVRASGAYETRVSVKTLPPGGQTRIDAGSLKGMYRNNAQVAMSFSTAPNLDFAGLYNSLDRYAYGCLEQTVSRALPLLYLDDVGAAAGIVAKRDDAVRQTLADALDRVLAMQTPDGAFGFWGSADSADEWLTAYALEFLVRAKAAGVAANDRPAVRAAEWLARRVDNADFAPPALAQRSYSYYALMQADAALKPASPFLSRGQLSYFADVYGNQLPDPLARAMLSAALSAAGDSGRAEKYADAAVLAARKIAASPTEYPAWTYGSPVRDIAGVVAILAERPGTDARVLNDLALALAERRGRAQYLSTQDMAWMMRAAHALLARGGKLALTVDGKPVAADKLVYGQNWSGKQLEDLDRGLGIVNKGTTPVFQAVSVTAVPVDSDSRPADSKGMRIRRALWHLDGTPADRQALTQNDLVVVTLDIEVDRAPSGEVLAVDLLPAGLEIENSRLFEGRAAEKLAWLGAITAPIHTEIRDDRFIAGLRVSRTGGTQTLRTAYLARAVSPGRFRAPGAYVEDMYRPEFFGRSTAETTLVKAK